MCTQQLIWCSCGHGEFLPIEKCQRATALGYCWTVVWGDHDVVIELPCSYCKAGLNRRKPLGKVRPAGEVTSAVETNAASTVRSGGRADGTTAACMSTGQDAVPVTPIDLAVPELRDSCELHQHIAPTAVMVSEVGLPTPPHDWEDILGTDFTGDFDLDPELWQYV